MRAGQASSGCVGGMNPGNTPRQSGMTSGHSNLTYKRKELHVSSHSNIQKGEVVINLSRLHTLSTSSEMSHYSPKLLPLLLILQEDILYQVIRAKEMLLNFLPVIMASLGR